MNNWKKCTSWEMDSTKTTPIQCSRNTTKIFSPCNKMQWTQCHILTHKNICLEERQSSDLLATMENHFSLSNTVYFKQVFLYLPPISTN